MLTELPGPPLNIIQVILSSTVGCVEHVVGVGEENLQSFGFWVPCIMDQVVSAETTTSRYTRLPHQILHVQLTL
jgi:hypothetical protein